MLRSTFIRSVARASMASAMRPAVVARPMPSFMSVIRRSYSTENGLQKQEVEKRIIDVLKSFQGVSTIIHHDILRFFFILFSIS